jgi:GDP-L-fucose synthase
MSTPVSFLVDNWQMGSNLVQAARQAGVEKLVNLGSSCMYPRGHDEPLREEQVLSGELEPTNEGYAIAKCAVARLCDYVRRETPEFKYKTIIPCNLYGRYDHFNPDRSHLIAAIIHKLHIAKRDGHKEVEIWGDGSARREFMWAGDLATALMRASENFDTLPDYMNIGLGHDYSVDDYYRVGASAVGYEGEYVHNLGKPVGMQRKLVDVVRARNWGWSYQTELEEGLRATYEHYLELETFR